MPGWRIHLEVGNRLKNILDYKIEDFNIFQLGNILPDINRGYVVKGVSKIVEYNTTHFVENNDKKMYINFYNNYKEIFDKEPIVMGYFIHLLTDFIWNKDFYSTIDSLDRSNLFGFTSAKDLKHNEFNKYNNKYIDNSLNILNINCALEKIKIIDRVSITKSDLTKVIDYFDAKKLDKFNHVNYYLFNEKYFDNLLNKTVKISRFFINKIRQNFI